MTDSEIMELERDSEKKNEEKGEFFFLIFNDFFEFN